MDLTDKQIKVLNCKGNLIVTGGPGSGKTTVSILKAAEIAKRELKPHQKVLFLSFARASVHSIINAIADEQSITPETESRIDVDTYHGFFWRFLRSHGYLKGLPRSLEILPSASEAVALSEVRSTFGAKSKLSKQAMGDMKAAVWQKKKEIACEEGLICFDVIANFVGSLLHRSIRLRRLIANKYPTIIFDEFQDTDADQWNVVKALGEFSRLIALADPEQRIYDFIGADPERLEHFRKECKPTEIDFGDANFRSAGTEIVEFANAILKGDFEQASYKGVELKCYTANNQSASAELLSITRVAIDRLQVGIARNWSLAILVSTKKMTRIVSDMLREPSDGKPSISHYPVVDMEGAVLASKVIALLMQPYSSKTVRRLVDLLCDYHKGKRGDKLIKSEFNKAERLSKAYNQWYLAIESGRTPRNNSVLRNTFAVINSLQKTKLTGNPDEDWRTVRTALENGKCEHLKEVGSEVRNIRLLERGTILRQELSQDWRDNKNYANALAIVHNTFIREHFSTNLKPEVGVVVMNMHKAKGKQFDEVIVLDGFPNFNNGKIAKNQNRIVWNNDRNNVDDSSRQNLRVSFTRGRQCATFLTPRIDKCVLLVPDNTVL